MIYGRRFNNAFTPASLTNVKGWYDASRLSTLTLSGSSVTSVTDRSGQGNNISAAVGSRPTYVSAGIGGLGTFAFSGSQGFTGGFTAFSAQTVFLVAKLDSAASSSGTYALASWGTFAPDIYVHSFQLNVQEAAGAISSFTDVFVNGGSTYIVVVDITVSTKAINVYCKGAGSGSFGSTSNPQTNASTINSATTFWLGEDSTAGGDGWLGQIGEMVITSDVKNSTDRTSMISYLSSKWGV